MSVPDVSEHRVGELISPAGRGAVATGGAMGIGDDAHAERPRQTLAAETGGSARADLRAAQVRRENPVSMTGSILLADGGDVAV
jgi:hypothetical protein